MSKRAVKLCATLAFSAMLVMTMGATAFAASIPSSGDSKGVVNVENDTTLTIAKSISVKNANLASVAAPDIQYDFSVIPATVASTTTVTDKDSHTATVHPGVTDGLVVSENPSFKNKMVDASSSGAINSDNIELTADPSKFSAPGIYRYKLTDDTTAAALTAAGIVRSSSYDPTRYIDVYIERASDDQGFVVKGYVIGSDENEDGVLVKETFETATNGNGGANNEPAATTDSYTTYNIVVSKNVTGNMGDRNHQFGFAGVVSENAGKAFYAKKGAAPTEADSAQTETAINTTLAHGESFYISGLAPQAKIAWTETNDTSDTYKVTVDGANSNIVAESDVAAGATKVMAAQNVTNYSSSATQETQNANNASITFTNDFTSVSPTGLVLRFGTPIALILAGLAVFVLLRRARKDEANLS